MKISLIVAMAKNRVIGMENRLPWHLPADLKKFRKITMGFPILMGRKTYESIGRPLPGRTNIIISKNPNYYQEDCIIFNSTDAALDFACQQSSEIFVIGGASFYELMLPKADVLYITEIDQTYTGDTFFPVIEESQWQKTELEVVHDDPEVDFVYRFLKLERTKTGEK